MDKTPLVDKDIQEGERLIKTLDERDFGVHSAFWFYLPKPNEWRLVIVTDLVDELGPREAYARLQREISKIQPELDLTIRNISMISPKADLIQLLRRAIKTGRSISHTRFTANVINGVLIDDAYLYRIQ